MEPAWGLGLLGFDSFSCWKDFYNFGAFVFVGFIIAPKFKWSIFIIPAKNAPFQER